MARMLRRAGAAVAVVGVVALSVVSSGSAVAATSGPSTLCTITGLPSTSKAVVVPHVINATVNTCANENTPPNQPCSFGVDQSGLVTLHVYECTLPIPGLGVPTIPLPGGSGGGAGGGSPPPPSSGGTGGSGGTGASSAQDNGAANAQVAGPAPSGQSGGGTPAAQRASASRAVVRSVRLSANRRSVAVAVQCAAAPSVCETVAAVLVGKKLVTKALIAAIPPHAVVIYRFRLTAAGIRAVRRGTILRAVAMTNSASGLTESVKALRVKRLGKH
jgi:hypothetical protein